MSKSARRQIVADLCAEHPDAPARTLAKRLHHDHPAMFPTVETARDAVRIQFGVHGERNRRYKPEEKQLRPTRPAGYVTPLPESEARPWEPFVIDARRVLVMSDIHCPFHDTAAIEAALSHGDTYKPDAVFVNGDFFDYFQLSRFDKNPTIASVELELERGRQLWTHIRERFPKARLYMKLGNHDERWAKYIYSAAPLLAGVKPVLDAWLEPAGIIENKVTVIGDQRPVMLGKLPVFHGHELGRSIFSPVNPARGAFLRSHHTILVGHSHQTSGHADTNVWHEETFCWSTGCLCGLNPDYAKVNRWNHGFATVDVHKSGDFDVSNLRIADGKVRKS